ncbi:uncharacterized protein LOC129954053 [Eupeodes corollae]|uniref:uncharacterized protein LOC129954053 n=1 Tax=Eupeodes corollae TaxID=290404 RepID=UPI002493CBF3|nr:uncharacterized protein LOC129954053 [Eupeodes corollae]
MSSSDRSIPHLRDIFGINNYSTYATSTTTTTNNNNGITTYNNTEAYVHNPVVDLTKKHSKKKRDNNKTLTSGDVKTLERHLSMKKTIRKKIMRDLQQAFVEDPNEFKIENSNHEHLKSEIRADAFRFGEKTTRKSDNFLDMLRGEKPSNGSSNHDTYNNANSIQSRDYDFDSSGTGQSNGEKQSFWRRLTMKGKSKR